MSYISIEDEFWAATAEYDIDLEAVVLLLEMRSWSRNRGKDGFVSVGALRTSVYSSDPKKHMQQLVDSGLAIAVEGGWEIDWSHQETEEQKAARKARDAEKSKKYRDLRKQPEEKHAAGDHSMCFLEYCAGASRWRKEPSSPVASPVTIPV